MKARKWGTWVAAAGVPCCAAFGALDLADGRPVLAGLMAGGVVVNAWGSRTIFRATARARHRPDYKRIAQLEQELGLVRPKPRDFSTVLWPPDAAAAKKIADLEQQVRGLESWSPPEPEPLLRPAPRGPYYLPDLPGASAHEKYMNRIGRFPPPPDQ